MRRCIRVDEQYINLIYVSAKRGKLCLKVKIH